MEQEQNRPAKPKKRNRGPNKATRRRTASKRRRAGCGFALLYMIIILGISCVLSVIAIFLANDVLALVTQDYDVSMTVDAPITLADVSTELEEQGVVTYAWAFDLFINVTGKDDDTVTAGTYIVNPNMDYGQLADTFTDYTSTETVDVAIPEGYTVDQIVTLLEENGVVTAAQMEVGLTEYAFSHDFLAEQLPPSENWLEGYLFPDTYTFYVNTDAVWGVLNRLLNNFDDKYDEVIQEGAEELGLTINEVVIIASLIEREAQKEEEFTTVSGVIHNRLNNSSEYPYLQVDAALLYVLDQKTLTPEDLTIESPYNLYTSTGLPPTAICNPGYAALYAATHPDDHNYYYYVAMPDGSHIFSTTYNEHLAAIETSNAAAAEVAAAADTQE